MPFTGIVLLALLGLWLALFPLVRRTSQALECDRSARREAEEALRSTTEQLRQSQKLEGIGRLASGVAHDFNNLLLAINGYAEFLVAELRTDRHREFARQIVGAGERATRLTQQLLAFSRRQVLQPRLLELNVAVREAASLLRPILGDGIATVVDLDPELRPVEADPGQISQVLVNLAVNGRDAMAGARTLVLATRSDGAEVVLSVSDTGCGMDGETVARIFEPFFTTKGVRGTGLGLSTVYGIVAQSGGPIDIASSALREARYEVAVAASPKDALGLGGRWDLPVSDVVMPGMNGPELAARVDASAVLYVSGDAPEGIDLGGDPLLQKPFDLRELRRTVRRVLDREPALT